ncbi:MAG TPA: hypothetical protein VHS99_15325 [Chloroflexota bacterium]|nr:hypothetical protein [Chloroflexota bacterium]
MYTAYKTEIGKLRAYERELTARYAETLLRRRFDDARALYEHRQAVRHAIRRAEEWSGDDGLVVQLPRQAALEEELARAA